MSTKSKQSHLPAKDAAIQPRLYHLGLTFHPQLRLTSKKKGFEFAAALSDYIDPTNVTLEGDQWSFVQPIGSTAKRQFQVIVQPGQIQIHAEFPSHAKEWFEDRQIEVLSRFAEAFQPQMILQTAVMMRVALQIDGDARIFLARHLMNLNENQLQRFGRPIHLIGLRLSFPPFSVQGEDGSRITDWLVDLRAESLAEDPSKLFLEADARWPRPMAWTRQNLDTVLERQRTVSDYLKGDVMRSWALQAERRDSGMDCR